MKVFLTLLFLSGYSCTQGYYWRDYARKIPSDAFVAGKDRQGNNIYVGQAFLKRKGLIVCQIDPRKTEVTFPFEGNHKAENIKILCGPPGNFEWVKVNYISLHKDISGKQPVLGGHEGGGTAYVGRLEHKGEIKIGRVAAFWVGYSFLLFNDGGVERRVEDYEVLTYKEEVGSESAVDLDLDTTIEHVFGKYEV